MSAVTFDKMVGPIKFPCSYPGTYLLAIISTKASLLTSVSQVV